MGLITGNPGLNGDGSPLPSQVGTLDMGSVASTPQIPATTVAAQAQATTAATSASPLAPTDFRARLSALAPDSVYPAGTGLMAMLAQTGGMIFPYAPTIQYSQSVVYQDLQLVHSNSDFPAYTRTPSVTLTVSGKFSVQNQREGLYALAVIHFLRTVSKSHFGENDPLAGIPPPILLFSAYGTYMFNRLRVILKSHSWSYDEAMDTIAINVPANGAVAATQVRLPAMFTIQTELQVVQTPQRMRQLFNFQAFASGQLMGDGGWI